SNSSSRDPRHPPSFPTRRSSDLSGSLIATASRDHTAKIWDLKSQRELATLGGSEQKVSAVAFTPDEKSVLTLSGDGKIKVWDLRSEEHTSELQSRFDLVCRLLLE